MALKWQALRSGDVVDIVAPGFATDAETLQKAVEFLESWELRPRLPAGLIQKHFLFANSDAERWKHFKKALQAPDSKAIWCLRGGYGSLRLLPQLARLRRPRQVKLLIGISDVCSLHSYLNQQWDWPTLHATLLDRLGQGRVPLGIQKQLKSLLMGKISSVEFSGLKALNPAAQKVSRLKGSVVGGNLTVMQSLLATPYDFDLKNKFLLAEDIGERGYRLDRMLVHFGQAGKFKGCKGLLLGHFTGGDEPQGGNLIKAVLNHWAQEQKIPVFSGIESGHGEKLRSLPLGTTALVRRKMKSFTLEVMSGVRP